MRWRFSVWIFADKDRELGEAQAEIKALRFSASLREKAAEEALISVVLSFRVLNFLF